MKILFLILALIFYAPKFSFALDWKVLHDEAGIISEKDALSAVAREPKSIEKLYTLGLVYLNLHKDKEADKIFNNILTSHPDLIEAKWGLAEVLRRKHRINEAGAILGEVMKIDAGFPPAVITLAYIKYLEMDFQGAMRLALKVMQLGRDNVDLDNYVRSYAMYAGSNGMIAHYGGPISKTINGLAVKPNLDKAQELSPNSIAALFGLGNFYLLAPKIIGGDKAKAEEYLKRAIKADPLFPDAYVRLAQLYKIKGDINKFNFYMNEAQRIDPMNELLLDTNSGRCKFICIGGKE